RYNEFGKFSPHFVGPYEILRCVGKVAYELGLTNELASVYSVFHISRIKMFVGDLIFIGSSNGLRVNENIYYEEVPVGILIRQVMNLRKQEVTYVKVFSRNLLVEGTWDAEANVMSRYPHIFRPLLI
ncbi:hypothetical protein MTR67_023112, partial [Solanum verrucosum]